MKLLSAKAQNAVIGLGIALAVLFVAVRVVA